MIGKNFQTNGSKESALSKKSRKGIDASPTFVVKHALSQSSNLSLYRQKQHEISARKIKGMERES